MGKLNIYRASAGSGKTYTLTEQYIGMLMNTKDGNPNKFRNVLAVTFTNKATDEMKGRITSKLYEISKSDKPVMVAGKMLEPSKAKELLIAILQNYSYFRVTTIDKFFQQIIRSFVRELGINSNYNVELDVQRVISNTINNIMVHLDEGKYAPFMDWFSEQIEEADGDKINFQQIIESIEGISKEIFMERYNRVKHLLPDDDTIRRKAKELQTLRKSILEEAQSKAEHVLELIKSEGLTKADFPRGALTPLYDTINNTDALPTLNPTILKFRSEGVKEFRSESSPNHRITDFIDFVESNRRTFNTCNVILHNIKYFRLFKLIENEVNSNVKGENTQLLSRSGEFIKRIIDGSDTPFIYEKTGTYIDNFLIDEFQDTSHIQWDNFKPLISNSLSEGFDNLIVGDVKQSIYRFRDSDWSILGKEILEDEQFKAFAEPKTLDVNHRSLGNIVEFNNTLFKAMAEKLQDYYCKQSGRADNTTITDAYKDIVQKLPDESLRGKGYVNIEFIENERGSDAKLAAFDKMYADIEMLLSNGYKYSDIGILVRKNREADAVAEYLLDKGVKVISEEALKVASCNAVQDITAILRYIIDRNNPVNNFLVENIIYAGQEIDLESLSKLPLYEIVEQIIYTSGYNDDNDAKPYLSAFKDLVMDYISRNGSDIHSFLEWWKEIKDSANLTTASEADAVTITTLHKSKGLSYKVVIMPLLNWSFTNSLHRDILWEQIPDGNPLYEELKCVPIEFSDTLKDTIFREQYYDETLKLYIDNINALYVSFTRAKEVLIGYCQTTKTDPMKDAENKTFKSTLPLLHASMQKIESGKCKIENGNSPLYLQSASQPTDNFQFSILPSVSSAVNFQLSTDISPIEKLQHFKLRSDDAITPEIERGSRMHRVMEHIKTIDDLAPVLQDMADHGYITEEQQKELKEDLTSYILNPAVREWFNTENRILSERSIIKNHHTWRPDRVIIGSEGEVTIVDYKFGEAKEKKHISQVQNYMALYKEAGYNNITGYIYYFENLEVIKV
ncbi:MAG: UvrD-helicase domain-containing protein [Paludibacteraceae bacterium]|nr:UvrD-helicase domain-containing protein [Paludibacteraceae bacterium]